MEPSADRALDWSVDPEPVEQVGQARWDWWAVPESSADRESQAASGWWAAQEQAGPGRQESSESASDLSAFVPDWSEAAWDSPAFE